MSSPWLSPFRYPGGKAWLLPHIRLWLESLPQKPRLFVEPFAGGANVSLAIVSEDLASRATIVELDAGVAAVWDTILSKNGGGHWLGKKIVGFDLTRLSAEKELQKSGLKGRALAFQTILKNRVNRGGILADGAGLLNAGENNNGLKSRWYPETLRGRISRITDMREKVVFVHGDGLEFLKHKARNTGAVFFIDPPYTIAGNKTGARLYTHCDIDHEELFEIANSLAGDFLLTYNNSARVRRLADRYGFDIYSVTMTTTHHKKKRELLIGRNLDWCRKNQSS